MFSESSTHDYTEFLEHFSSNGYRLLSFAEATNYRDAEPFAILRHDVDFDCELAHRMAATEKEFGVRSTYFFLVSSESYNIASPKNRAYIEKILDMGHEVGIHFDPLVYPELARGFECERGFVEQLFDIEIRIISIHRPTPFFLESDEPLCGVDHTYQSKYTKDLKYFSDSTGVWRYGHPANSDEFATKQNLHILIHPIWWTGDTAGENTEKIRGHYLRRVGQIKDHYADNCKPFGDIYDTI